MPHVARVFGTVTLGLLLLGSPALAGGIAIIGTDLSDNGDDDGFADTYETVRLYLTIENTSGLDLQDLTLRLSTDAAEIACISRPLVYVGELTAGEVRPVEDAFVFAVGDVDRSTLGLDERDDLSVEFGVFASADRLSASTLAPTITFDLDLDIMGGSGPTQFFEGFESGTLGALTHQNLDAGRNNFAGSDGYRCQYHDPDWPASLSYGFITDCYLGATPQQADAVFWQVDGPELPGRSFGGGHSLYYGVEDEEYYLPSAPIFAEGITVTAV